MESIVLEMKNISKGFPGTQALKDVSIDLRRGEVLALLGENGAGKSTLVKILYGAYIRDHGEVLLDGKEVAFKSPHDALRAGIAMIPQEINLAQHLTATQNIFLGEELAGRTAGLLGWRVMKQEAKKLLAGLGMDIDVDVPIGRLSTAYQQMVAIAKALYVHARIIIMDEPTSSLTEREIEQLFSVIRSLKQQSVSIIYISHRLQEIPRIADRVTVLKDGMLVGTLPINECSEDRMVLMMVGRTLEAKFPHIEWKPGAEAIRVEGFTRTPKLKDISFSVGAGEIVGMFGLVGAGRTEVARAVFGLDPKDAGRVYLAGREVAIKAPKDAINAGIGFVTEDRKKGLLLKLDVMSNMVMAAIPRMCRAGFIDFGTVKALAERYRQLLRVKTPSLTQKIVNLSGGNQQKIALAKWFCTQSKVIIFDEPTRGIDVQAKLEVYEQIKQFVDQGGAAIMISSELPEILGMSHRVLVIHEGELMGELSRAEATEEKIMSLASGIRPSLKPAV